MELSQLIKNKMEEVQNLKKRLEKIESDLEKVNEKFPPRWSGNIRELNKFVDDLEKWIRNPQLKRARDLIEKLKMQGNDERSFSGLSEDYLVNNLNALERAVEFVSKIENVQLKVNSAKKILNEIQEEKSIENLLDALNKYWESFKRFEETKAPNDFLIAVKKDLTDSLVKIDDPSPSRINSAQNTLEKASSAINLLAGLPVSVQAYIETYKNSKSVDTVWNYADGIRKLLRTRIECKTEVGEPFTGILDYLNRRNECMNKNSLEEIYNCLKENITEINKWKDEVKKVVGVECNKIKHLADFAGLQSNIDQISGDLVRNLETFNIDNAYSLYQKLQEIRSRAIEMLGDKISDNERRIIENMQKADELVDEMGESFWENVKSLRNKRLIKIVIERGP
jgi:tetratricopeptide (TPR) repeat protein